MVLLEFAVLIVVGFVFFWIALGIVIELLNAILEGITMFLKALFRGY